MRKNHPLFLGSKVGKDPQESLVGVYKVLNPIGVTSREKVELSSYQFREVAQVWYINGKIIYLFSRFL